MIGDILDSSLRVTIVLQLIVYKSFIRGLQWMSRVCCLLCVVLFLNRVYIPFSQKAGVSVVYSDFLNLHI